MKKIVGLLFSKDRAMQLDATVRSLAVHCGDMQEIDVKVIFVASTIGNEQQYQELATTYSDIEFIKQVDFESQVLSSMVGYEYVLFLVDDNIFVGSFSVNDIIGTLKDNPDALGFSLRLGTNTTYCYPLRVDQQLPLFTKIDHEFLKFDWTSAQYDFGYPLEVSSSIFRVGDMMTLLQDHFTNPNTLEAYLDSQKIVFYHKPFLLCNVYSCAFSNPINKVQNTFNNRTGEVFSYSIDNLKEMFIRGHRIDVAEYSGFIPNACHQEVKLKFRKIPQDSGIPVATVQQATPKVSVIMPVYNAEEYVSQAIESILGQTFEDFELIIIDDGSTDHSARIIKNYYDPRIRFVRNESNRKLIATLNKGMSMAKGKYIARMDADDISLPGRLARQVEFMDGQPSIGVCGTWVEIFGEGEPSFWRFTDHPDGAKCMLLFGCCIVHPSVMIRKAVFETGLCYLESYPHGEDYALWTHIAQQYEITNIPEVLMKYRKSQNQVSSKYADIQVATTLKIQREQLNALGIEPTEDECHLHWSIGLSEFTPSISFAHSALRWLTKLKEANSKVRYYPEPVFSNLLQIYWKGVCNTLMNAF